MKKFTQILLIVLVIATCIFAVVACNPDKPQDQLSISEINMPQTVFVKGNDIDLSAAKLKAVKGKEQTELALNAEGVVVTGYDKNKLGEQTLTVTYGGASKTITVNVVERMVVENHVSEYIIGEKFNNTGRVTITKDDGNTFNVFLRDEKLTATNFDTSQAGQKQVDLKYKDETNEFVGFYTITVYAADENGIKLVRPTKRLYNSHDTEIDSTGGYFSITAKNGELKKSVPIDDSKISGFDPSVVKDENVKQTISVEYAGQTFTFDIEIRLSNVTIVKRAAKTLSALDWSGDTASQVSEEQGKLALNALKLFYQMNDEDSLLIIEDEEIDLMNLVRPAAVYGLSKWAPRVEQFDDLFVVSNTSVTLTCDDYATTKAKLEVLSEVEDDDLMYDYGNILADTYVLFYGSEYVMFGKVTVADYLNDICPASYIKDAIAKIEYMLKMHEALKDIPADWQLEDLTSAENAEKIESAHAIVVEFAEKLGEFPQNLTERYIFNTVSSWREDDKNDYFEILYRYYFEFTKSSDQATYAKGVTAINNMIDVCMPGMLESLFMLYINAYMDQIELAYSGTPGSEQFKPASELNTFKFVSAYRNVIKVRDMVLESEDEMILALYENFNLGQMIAALQTNDFGLFDIFGSAYGEESFEEVWTKYIAAVAGLADFENAGEKIENMLVSFVALTPELQTLFVSSLNPYNAAVFAPNDGTDRATTFYEMLIYYYASVFPENLIMADEENGIVFELLDALQFYVLRNEYSSETQTYLDLFLQKMKSAKTMYTNMSASDKELFDAHMGFFYERYMDICSLYDEKGKYIESEISEEWQAEIEAIETMFNTLNALMELSVQSYAVLPVYISAYEITVDAYNNIMENAPQEVKNILLYSVTDMFKDMTASIETFMYQYRSIFINYLTAYPVSSQEIIMAWDSYQSTNLREYMSSIFGFYVSAIVNSEDTKLTLDIVKEAINGFHELSDGAKVLFIYLEGEGQYLFFDALDQFYIQAFGSESKAYRIAERLVNIEYNLDLTNEQFMNEWKSIETAYAALTEAEKELFDTNLKETYDYYKSVYERMTQTDEEE